MLLVGAGLLLRSFLTLLDVDMGFRPEQTVAWRVDVGGKYPNRLGFYQNLVRRFQEVPGVESVGLTDTLPLGRNRTWGIQAKGEVYQRGETPIVFPRMVDSGYIKTMGIPLIAGREFTEHDTTATEKVMIINERAAQRLWPGKDAIGQIVLCCDGEWRIIGVVANVRHSSLEEESGLEMYMPVTQQNDWGAVDVVIRTKLPLQSLAPSIRAALHEADPALPAGDFQTLGQIVDRAVSPRRFIVLLLGAFAVTALLLASLGIYGVVSYSVNQRTQEIGIRMALGASAASVRWGVITQTLGLAFTGVVIGVAGSFVLARLMASLLYGVTPGDPATFAAMIGSLALIAVVAGYLPARRASRIEPMSVLRSA
jgi:predicted permease